MNAGYIKKLLQRFPDDTLVLVANNRNGSPVSLVNDIRPCYFNPDKEIAVGYNQKHLAGFDPQKAMILIPEA